MKHWRALLIVIAVICFGVALSYPIRYRMAQESNNSELKELSAMRQRVQEQAATPQSGNEPSQNQANPTDGQEAAAGQNDSAAFTHAMDDPTKAEHSVESDGGFQGEAPGSDADSSPQVQADAPQPEGEARQGGAQPTLDAPGSEDNPSATDAQAQPPVEHPPEAPVAEGSPGATLRPEGVPAHPTRPQGSEAAQDQTSLGGGEVAAEPARDTEDATRTQPQGAQDGSPAMPTPIVIYVTPEVMPTPIIIYVTPEPSPTPTPGLRELMLELPDTPAPNLEPTATPTPTLVPTPTPDRTIRLGAKAYPDKEKILFDEEKLLPELREIYELNHDLIGWLVIPDTVIDYPVVQTKDSEFYLDHDFYGNENINGQLILDPLCDPYTPSYNLIISGHHMKNGSMFGNLPQYASKSYWQRHRFLEFDSLMTRKQYVIFACFFSADYDEDEEGFRYNADLRYRLEVDKWLEEVRANQLYDTGIDVKFGDEIITLTTCDRARHRNGRFVVVCRQVREGETFE